LSIGYQNMVSVALDKKLIIAEREVILAALEKAEWIRSRAAEIMEISEMVLRL